MKVFGIIIIKGINLNESEYSNQEESNNSLEFDYSFVYNAARVAIYDDALTEPRVIEIEPDDTYEFIANLAKTVYTEAQNLGGGIQYSPIEQLTENFIHARFAEVTVSIFDKGNTIRFSDQGPGIKDKQRARQLGFSSATRPMKEYIHGVGSGLFRVEEIIQGFSHGSVEIEDNVNGGTVVTISLKTAASQNNEMPVVTENTDSNQTNLIPGLSLDTLSKPNQKILGLFKEHKTLGVTDICNITSMPQSSCHNNLKKLEELGLLNNIGGKRSLTNAGLLLIQQL